MLTAPTRWSIRVRVANVSTLRDRSTNDNGKFFWMDVLDKSATIRVFAFDDIAVKTHPLIKFDHVCH
jgi:hypothetical protein